MYKKVLPLCIVALLVLTCQGGGGYRDRAMITDAERNLGNIRNALEEYWVDNGTYPKEGTNLEKALHPYFLKIRIKENKDAPLHSANVENARNQMENAEGFLYRVKRQAVPLLDSISKDALLSHIERIEELINQYRVEIEGGKAAIDINANQEFSSMLAQLKSMNPDSIIDKTEGELIDRGKEIINKLGVLKNAVSGLEMDPLKKTDIISKIDAISQTFRVYEATLTHQTFAEAQVVVPEHEIGDIEIMLGDVELTAEQLGILEDVKQLINQYRSLEIKYDDAEIFKGSIQSLERASAIIYAYENTLRRDVQISSVILQANIALRKMANALEDYRRDNGQYPPQDINLDSILHPYFIEVTMGGDTIDRYDKALSNFVEMPSYYTDDPTLDFELKATVANEARTPIFIQSEIISDWNEVLSAFSEPPVYRTINPKVTYFLTAKAKDSRKTLVCERSPVRGK